MDNLKRYSNFIKRIVTTSSPNLRKKLLNSSNLNIIKAICELILNIVQKNIIVNKRMLTQLKRHKSLIYKLLLNGKDFESRKTILVNNSKIILPLADIL